MNYYTISVSGFACRPFTFRGWAGSVPVVSRPEGAFYGCRCRFDLRRLSSGRLAEVHASGAPLAPVKYASPGAASRAACLLRLYFGDVVRVDIVGHE